MRKEMDHTAVFGYLSSLSDTLSRIWQNGPKKKYCNFATFNRIVDTKTSKYYPNRAKYIKCWLENESQLIMNFRFLRISSLISKYQRENIFEIIEKYKLAKIRKRRNQKKTPTPKTKVGKNQTNNQVLIPRKHFASRMSSYFPNRWPLSYLNLTKICKHT